MSLGFFLLRQKNKLNLQFGVFKGQSGLWVTGSVRLNLELWRSLRLRVSEHTSPHGYQTALLFFTETCEHPLGGLSACP